MGNSPKTTAQLIVRNILPRLAMVLLLAVAIGIVLNRVAEKLDRAGRPAGFVRGVLQGALMPMAMPNLLVGRDINIYSQNNTGVTYKLGYTMGVNGCGVLFFGFLFTRLTRLRNWAKASGDPRDMNSESEANTR